MSLRVNRALPPYTPQLEHVYNAVSEIAQPLARQSLHTNADPRRFALLRSSVLQYSFSKQPIDFFKTRLSISCEIRKKDRTLLVLR